MLQNTAVLKVSGAIAAVGGTAGAGYFAHTQGIFVSEGEMLEDESVTKYLIVKSVALNKDEEKDEAIYKKGIFSKTEKNFMCSLKGAEPNKEDKTCEIYKLSNQEKNLAQAIKNNFSANSSNLKKNDNYFKLKVSDDFTKEIKKWGDATETIDIVSLDKSKENKKFGKLIPIYLVDNNKIIKRKTSVLLAKVASTNSDAPSANATNTNKNYECKTTSPETKFDCLVSEVTFNDKKVNTITTPINQTQGELTNLKTQNKYFVIEMDEEHLNKFVFTDNSIKNFEIISKGENSKKYSDLTPLFKILDKDVFSKDHYWLLTATLSPTTGTVDSSTWTNNYTECEKEKEKTACSVYKFTSTQTDTAKDAIDFSNGLTKAKADSDITANTAFAIKMTKNTGNIDKLKENTEITLISKDTTKKNYVFSIKHMFFVEPTSTNGDTLTLNGAYILDL